jgi:DNA invertase Pin-like site-specific DNA recombinase
VKAAIYARYSTDLQRQASIEDQYRTCLARIEREDWTVVAKYKDEAVSGAKADRPGYQALLKAAKNREFDVLVVEEVSRLWRDQEEQWGAVKRLEFWGVHIIGCNDGIDTRAGYGLLLGIRGALNEEARREIGKRTHRGLEGVALNGHNAGGRSYGYRHVAVEDPTRTDHLGRPLVVAVKREIDPEQARQVRRIFKWFVEGYSPRQIADRLNALGVPSPGEMSRLVRLCDLWRHKARVRDFVQPALFRRVYLEPHAATDRPRHEGAQAHAALSRGMGDSGETGVADRSEGVMGSRADSLAGTACSQQNRLGQTRVYRPRAKVSLFGIAQVRYLWRKLHYRQRNTVRVRHA